jgi:hypothetical protein
MSMRSTSRDPARHCSSLSSLIPTLSVLVTLFCWRLAPGARAQSEAKSIATAERAPVAQLSPPPNPTCTPVPADGDLQFVLALFRHGVRSPLEDFGEKIAPRYSGNPWPGLTDWADGDKCASWGDLTPHGATAVTILGAWYGRNYSKTWGQSFKAYLWADTDERTEKTAAALATGLGASGVSVQVESLSTQTVDPLFHSFKAMCGTPRSSELDRIVTKIKANYVDWLRSHQDAIKKLEYVLDCKNKCDNKTLVQSGSPTPIPCEPLHCAEEKISAWASPTPTPGAPPPSPTPTPRPTSPITWNGQFSYASSATEAFLLEYANNMPPAGWGRVEVGQPTGSHPTLAELLALHEFYFDITERDDYLAGVGGANLLREIFYQLNRKAGKPLDGQCPHGDGTSQFVGLVGHDTNLANLNKLLNITWSFKDSPLPDDTRNLPDNDALPAGALVFELFETRKGSQDYRVRIQYVSQSPGEIRNAPQPGDPLRVQTTCGGCSPCEMPLEELKQIFLKVNKTFSPFLSNCQKNGDQTCLNGG